MTKKLIDENTFNKLIEILKIINNGDFYEFNENIKIGLDNNFNIGHVFKRISDNKEYVSEMISLKIPEIIKLIEEN